MSQWNNVMASIIIKINGFQKDYVFRLRDCVPNPQALWGRWFFESVVKGQIPNVVFHSKDIDGVNQYQKI